MNLFDLEKEINDIPVNDEENVETTLDKSENVDYNELEAVINAVQLKVLEIDTDELSKTKYDKESFEKGVKDFSYYAGAIAALTNIGVNVSDALMFLKEYVYNNLAMDCSIEIAKLNNDNTLKVAKLSTYK